LAMAIAASTLVSQPFGAFANAEDVSAATPKENTASLVIAFIMVIGVCRTLFILNFLANR
jgi:hypothetical protein